MRRTTAACKLLAVLIALLAVPVLAPGAEGTSFAGQGLSLTDLSGRKTSLDTLLAKGPVVINFWATWCGPCRAEMPQLQKVYQEMGPKGVFFAAVSLDQGMKREVLENFLKGRSIVLPVYKDDKGVLAKRFGVTAIPATFVLKPSGELAHVTRGYHPGDEILLRKKLEEIVASAGKAAGKKSDQ